MVEIQVDAATFNSVPTLGDLKLNADDVGVLLTRGLGENERSVRLVPDPDAAEQIIQRWLAGRRILPQICDDKNRAAVTLVDPFQLAKPVGVRIDGFTRLGRNGNFSKAVH